MVNSPSFTSITLSVTFPSWSNAFTLATVLSVILIRAFTGSKIIGQLYNLLYALSVFKI